MKMATAIFAFYVILFSGIALAEPGVKNCFEYNIDYDGTNINNGLQQRTNTADDCWTLCKLTLDCDGFTWASQDFAGLKKKI